MLRIDFAIHAKSADYSNYSRLFLPITEKMPKSVLQIAVGFCLLGIIGGCCQMHPTSGTPLPPGAQSHSRFHPVPTQPVFLARPDCLPELLGEPLNGETAPEPIPPGPATSPATSKINIILPGPGEIKSDMLLPAPGPDDVFAVEKNLRQAPAMGEPHHLAISSNTASAKSRSWIFTPPAPPRENPVSDARLPAELLELGKGNVNQRAVQR
jgi:hypothetical protein